MMSSLVRYPASARPGTSGIIGRAPAAITTCRPSMRDGSGGGDHLEPALADEPAAAGVHGDVGALERAVAPAALGDGVDATEHPVADVAPVDGVDVGIDAEPGGVLDGLHDVGGVHEHLRRDAPPVHAGAAEVPLLDDRDRQVVELGAEDGVAAAGSDDDEVVLLEAVHCGNGTGRRCWRDVRPAACVQASTRTGGSDVTAFHIDSSGAASIARSTFSGYRGCGFDGSNAGCGNGSAGRSNAAGVT